MKVLVTGVKGQLGFDVMRELSKRGIEGIGVDIDEMDITDFESVDRVITEAAPDAVIHCAAWTAVDAAEDEDKREKVRLVNVEGPRNIAKVCKKLDIKMLQISTDYVFDGQGERPWEPDDPTGPVSVYGTTKRDGENAVMELLDKFFIVRIAWAFGINGNNFVKTMLRVAKTHDTLTVVNDQWGSPTYTYDLARLLVDMIQTDKYGIYHATNEGFINWYQFATAIFKEAGVNVTVKPVTTAEYGISKAARPFNSRMSKDKLEACGFKRLPAWEDALKRYIKELKENNQL
ncbi:MAG: dTDP-4-dehydrorhamnose reductase [Lachnospiraceae bacterium]|nr:dTDP-4-dehydrorhamnose reductase [Lachnospiraceae bacterium]